MRAGLRMAARYGITTVVEPQNSLDDLALFQRAREEGELHARVVAALFHPVGTHDDDLDDFAAAARWHSDDWFAVGPLKLYIDDIVEPHTAAMLAPYANRPDTCGRTYYEPDELAEVVARLDARGFQCFVHATGDRGIQVTLDAFQHARRVNGARDSRHQVVHVECLDRADVGRFAELGVVACMQPRHCAPEIVGEWRANVGPQRWRYAWPMRSLVESGAAVAFSSDWNVAEMDPLVGMYTALTRASLDGTQSWVPEERVDVETALRGYTTVGAWANFRDHDRGMLSRGRLADLVVLSANPFEVEPAALLDATATLTVVGGRGRARGVGRRPGDQSGSSGQSASRSRASALSSLIIRARLTSGAPRVTWIERPSTSDESSSGVPHRVVRHEGSSLDAVADDVGEDRAPPGVELVVVARDVGVERGLEPELEPQHPPRVPGTDRGGDVEQLVEAPPRVADPRERDLDGAPVLVLVRPDREHEELDLRREVVATWPTVMPARSATSDMRTLASPRSAIAWPGGSDDQRLALLALVRRVATPTPPSGPANPRARDCVAESRDDGGRTAGRRREDAEVDARTGSAGSRSGGRRRRTRGSRPAPRPTYARVQRCEGVERRRLVGVPVHRHDDGAVGEVVVGEEHTRVRSGVDAGDLERATSRVRGRQQRTEVRLRPAGVRGSRGGRRLSMTCPGGRRRHAVRWPSVPPGPTSEAVPEREPDDRRRPEEVAQTSLEVLPRPRRGCGSD